MPLQLHTVSFLSGGITLTGHLRVPDSPGPLPAVVFTGALSSVKEQTAGYYAAALSERGYITLAFDHRNFGESGGTPRQHEDSAGKLADLTDATSYLANHPAVDARRIGCVGICMGASYALRHTAFDPRISALALVAGGYPSPGAMRAAMGASVYRSQLAALAAVAERSFRTAETAYMPVVSADSGEAVMPGEEPWAYYGTDRAASPGWSNRLTRLSLREILTGYNTWAAEFVSPTPVLMVHGSTDAYCPPEDAKAVFDTLGEPKQILWLPTSNHIDLYDNPEFVTPAVDRIATWFGAHLSLGDNA
ncbi:MAG: alpha/beta hydrolase [Kutzneria sp.]|nr:alpha/beta hydrolase [Kutzneria sp.]